MLLATINSGTLIIALPDLERALGTSILELVWVILAYMIASTVLVLTAGRLSRPLRAQERLRRRLRRLRARLAGRRLRRLDGTELILWRIVQGVGARVPVRERRRAGDRRVPARAARRGDGDEHDGRRGRARARPGAGRRARVDLVALGVLVQRAARRWPARCGAGWSCTSWPSPTPCAGSTCSGTLTFVAGLTGLVLGVSRGGISGWDDPLVIVGLIAGRRAAAAVRV